MLLVKILRNETDRFEQKSAGPDQTAPKWAVWSGPTLFAIPFISFRLITALYNQTVPFLGQLQLSFYMSQFLEILW